VAQADASAEEIHIARLGQIIETITSMAATEAERASIKIGGD